MLHIYINMTVNLFLLCFHRVLLTELFQGNFELDQIS